VWGFGVGGGGLGPKPQRPNPQSPIPNPQSPFINLEKIYTFNFDYYKKEIYI